MEGRQIDPIARNILDCVEYLLRNQEGIQDVLRALAESDWERLISEYQDEASLRRAIVHEAHMGVTVSCHVCGAKHPRRNMAYFNEIQRCAYKPYCSECAAALREEIERACVNCGEMFVDPYSSNPQCGPCRAKNAFAESCRLDRHYDLTPRWRDMLTIDQWMETLAHYGGMCAYCGRWPFTDLEHFIPQSQGGSTTADNCVPACRSCNATKSNRVPSENFAPQVRAYLATRHVG